MRCRPSAFGRCILSTSSVFGGFVFCWLLFGPFSRFFCWLLLGPFFAVLLLVAAWSVLRSSSAGCCLVRSSQFFCWLLFGPFFAVLLLAVVWSVLRSSSAGCCLVRFHGSRPLMMSDQQVRGILPRQVLVDVEPSS